METETIWKITALEEDSQKPISPIMTLKSLDKLLEQDKQREVDGFPRKVKVGKMLKPTPKGNKIRVVPTVEEEKLVHDQINIPQESSGGESGGAGEGEEGDKIGEEPAHDPHQTGEEGGGDKGEAGEGGGGEHEMEASAYELGKTLTEKFQLPNIQNKGKKKSLTQQTYDLTDKHAGTGQLLDKKSTLKQLIKTNRTLGRISSLREVSPSSLLIAPRDKIYRLLSPEKEYESQALVFFVRDYSGSMWGESTEVVVQTHILIYSWLLYQYHNQVKTRFIVHDTEAKELNSFYEYYNAQVAGGTKIAEAYKLVNRIITQENLARDYNIYVFHGTDGDDWDKEGKQTLPAIQETLRYANRTGITVAGAGNRTTAVENYLEEPLKNKKELLKLDKMPGKPDENRLIEGIRYLTWEGQHATN